MQLGARWHVGTTPHSGVPRAMHEAIARVEAEYPSASSWTLTWLEGRARAELFGAEPRALAEVRTDAMGEVRVVRSAAPGASGPVPAHSDGPRENESVGNDPFDDDDDDDWLA